MPARKLFLTTALLFASEANALMPPPEPIQRVEILFEDNSSALTDASRAELRRAIAETKKICAAELPVSAQGTQFVDLCLDIPLGDRYFGKRIDAVMKILNQSDVEVIDFKTYNVSGLGPTIQKKKNSIQIAFDCRWIGHKISNLQFDADVQVRWST